MLTLGSFITLKNLFYVFVLLGAVIMFSNMLIL